MTLNTTKFACAIPDIYPPELDLKRTTECPTTLSYLDLLITIDNGKYSTTVYDKRDDFNFCIVNFPHLSSNIPSKPAYGVYISQLGRIARICDTFDDRHYKLINSTRFLVHWVVLLSKCFPRTHACIFSKYGCSVRGNIFYACLLLFGEKHNHQK